MDDAEIRQQVDEFVALPRAERREKFASLPPEVRKRARKIIEARRGIAYRNEGVLVHTKDGYIAQLVAKGVKLADMPRRTEALKSNMVELKRQLQENYGDEALAEAETAIEAAVEANQPADDNA